jgi:hypothetical protein
MGIHRILTGSGAVAAALLLGACTTLQWPAERGGGAAEIWLPYEDRVSLVAATPEAEHILRRVERAERQLDELEVDGAARWIPAEIHTCRRTAVRIRRATVGGLLESAAAELMRLEDRLEALSRQMKGLETEEKEVGVSV